MGPLTQKHFLQNGNAPPLIVAFLSDGKWPILAGVRCGGSPPAFLRLYCHDAGTIADIKARLAGIATLVEQALLREQKVVCNDFRGLLRHLKIHSARGMLPIYDACLPSVCLGGDPKVVLRNQLDLLVAQVPQDWQCVAANAVWVYDWLERRGVSAGGLLRRPVWSYDTYSGRSKTTGYAFHGTTEPLSDPDGCESDLFVVFDWRAADIRVAALLSEDRLLKQITRLPDPYKYIAALYNAEHPAHISRDECKRRFLSAVNSLRIDDSVLARFSRLRQWMIGCVERLQLKQPLLNILGRPFVETDAHGALAVFNATMQGSIAQAMQVVMKRTWDVIGPRLFGELHDALVVTCGRDVEEVQRMISTVGPIMHHPLANWLLADPGFVVSVLVGSNWRKWSQCQMIYERVATNGNKQHVQTIC
jgi:hypothetical protein